MRCLLVDDEPGIREGLAMLLRRRGFEVVTAADCAAAQACLDEQSFDVVVTDWRLPDGVALAFLRDCEVPAIAVPANPVALPQPGIGRVTLEDIEFRYPTRPATAALHDVSFTVEPGETLQLKPVIFKD